MNQKAGIKYRSSR